MTRGEIYRSLAGQRKVKIVQQREAYDINITRFYFMDGDRREISATQTARFTRFFQRAE